jgi:GNAT superfamily N-acetyltransferase
VSRCDRQIVRSSDRQIVDRLVRQGSTSSSSRDAGRSQRRVVLVWDARGMTASPAEMLAAFEAQIRQETGPAFDGWEFERIGPILRITAPADSHRGGGVMFSDFSGMSGDEVDAVIRETVSHFEVRGKEWEWKTYAHDVPADLTDRLAAAGLVPEELEALVIGEVATVVASCGDAEPPEGVVVREASSENDFAGIAALSLAVWDEPGDEHVAELRKEKAADHEALRILVAVAGEQVVCAAWARFHAGTDFASLWGGSTHPDWRGRGVYRCLVGRRAAEAAERGFRYLQVDASPDSRPILERLGLQVVSTTTPYIGNSSS